MNISEMVNESLDLSSWLGDQLEGLSIGSDHRSSLAAGCLHMALEHQMAIAVLISRGLNGSAFSLVRMIYESLVRGLWLHHCATDAQIENYRTDKLDLHFSVLLGEVEKVPGWESGLLSKTKQQSWGAMNSFTHTGILQLQRRMSEVNIEPSYEESEILQILQFSGAIAILCGIAVARLVNNIDLASSMLKRADQFALLNQ
jgi:hypothetical protein